MRTIGIVAIALLVFGPSAHAEDALEALWKDYQSYGLPAPPKDAQLAHLPAPGVQVNNGVRHQDTYLVLLLKKPQGKERGVYWMGCEPGPQWHSIEFKPVTPKVDSLKGTVTLTMEDLGSRPTDFPTFPDLALAVQCHALGSKELAAELLERSRKPAKSRRDAPGPKRPRDDQTALALLAWNYYCNEFAHTKGDRKPIVERLKKLLAGPHKLDNKANRNIIADMERTLVPVKTQPNSAEAALEGLLEFTTDWGSWAGTGWDDIRNDAERNKNYKALQELGIAAVPVLIKHRDDFRLTRHIEQTRLNDYAWHLRIADVVAQLLNGLTDEPFAYDFLQADGRGICLDVNHVNAWWKEAGGAKELDYLLKHVERKERGDRTEGNGPVLQSLGSRYPNELMKLFDERLKTGKLDSAWFDALLNSKLSNADKSTLFLAAAAKRDEWMQIGALRALSHLDHADTAKLLIAALERQPRTPEGDYWLSNITNFAQIAIGMKDDKVWETMLKTAKRVDVGQRLQMLEAVARCSLDDTRRREIRFLQAMLADAEERPTRQGKFGGPGPGFQYDRITVRDLAAEQLGYIFKLKPHPESTWKEADWAKYREHVQAKLAEWEKSDKAKETK